MSLPALRTVSLSQAAALVAERCDVSEPDARAWIRQAGQEGSLGFWSIDAMELAPGPKPDPIVVWADHEPDWAASALGRFYNVRIEREELEALALGACDLGRHRDEALRDRIQSALSGPEPAGTAEADDDSRLRPGESKKSWVARTVPIACRRLEARGEPANHHAIARELEAIAAAAGLKGDRWKAEPLRRDLLR